MKIVSFGDYTFPLYDTEDTIPLDVRRALTVLPLADGAYDVHGDDGPIAPARMSKRFTILPASWAAMDTALDAIREVAGRGRQFLKIEMRDSTERQVWAKMSVRHPQTPEHHSFLPVTCDFEVAFPLWEASADRKYLGIHAGTLGSGNIGGQFTAFSLMTRTGVLQSWADRWLISDADVYQDDGFLTPVASDGDPVGGWKDQGTNAKDYIQDTAEEKPLYKTNITNEHPAIRFDGVNDFLTGGSVSGGPYHYYFVIDPPATGTGVRGLGSFIFSNTWIGVRRPGLLALTNVAGQVGYKVAADFYSVAAAAAGMQILVYRATVDTMTLFRNGIRLGADAYAIYSSSASALGIDRFAVNDFCDCDIAEFYMVDPSTSGYEARLVDAHLNARYRLGSEETGGAATPTITYDGGARFTGGYLEIMGACTNPKLENKTNGYWLQWTGSLVAGDRLVINLATGQAKKNGVVEDYALSKGDDQTILMALELGDNEMEFSATSADCVAEYYWSKWYP
ncbi:MAG: hypothetical protein PVJ86_12920 [Phycisphaerales bacterium]|jgi:hypothetical protein